MNSELTKAAEHVMDATTKEALWIAGEDDLYGIAHAARTLAAAVLREKGGEAAVDEAFVRNANWVRLDHTEWAYYCPNEIKLFINFGEHYDAGFLLRMELPEDLTYLPHLKTQGDILRLMGALGISSALAKAPDESKGGA